MGVLGIILPTFKFIIPDIDIWGGLYERVVAFNGFIWLEVVAIRLLFLCLRREG
jgi:hypothetical protein